MLWSLLAPIALAQDAPPIQLRLGAAGALDKHSPHVGIHASGSNPAGPLRTTLRIDFRTWQYPTNKEEAFWAELGAQDLTDHWRFQLDGTMGVRMVFTDWSVKGMPVRPGWELGLCAAWFHNATVPVQDAWAEQGATVWPLDEFLMGPQLDLGLFDPGDHWKISWMHRFYIPTGARLTGDAGRYTVGDETFEPVQVVNPVYQAGIVAHATFGHLFVRVAPTYRLSLPSAKNRAVDQSPPDGTVHVDLAVGWAF